MLLSYSLTKSPNTTFRCVTASFSTTSVNRLNSRDTNEDNGRPFQRDRTLTRYRRSMKLNSHRSTGQWTENIRALVCGGALACVPTHQGCGCGPAVSLTEHWPPRQREPENQVEKRSRWKKETPGERQKPHTIQKSLTFRINHGLYYLKHLYPYLGVLLCNIVNIIITGFTNKPKLIPFYLKPNNNAQIPLSCKSFW